MALNINTNIPSLTAQRNLSTVQRALERNIQRLSSGLRISSAADDPAGLAITQLLSAHVAAYRQAETNANEGVSISQVADSGLESMGTLLTRMRELATEAANGALDSTSRSNLNTEYQAMKTEIDRIANVVEFNGTDLLNGGYNVNFQVGINGGGVGTGDWVNLTISDSRSTAIGANGIVASLNATLIDTTANATDAMSSVDQAVRDISSRRTTVGSFNIRMETAAAFVGEIRENITSAISRIRDTDFASETAELTKNQIISQAAIAVIAQANQIPSWALSLLDNTNR